MMSSSSSSWLSAASEAAADLGVDAAGVAVAARAAAAVVHAAAMAMTTSRLLPVASTHEQECQRWTTQRHVTVMATAMSTLP
jgi:hypothetical protein